MKTKRQKSPLLLKLFRIAGFIIYAILFLAVLYGTWAYTLSKFPTKDKFFFKLTHHELSAFPVSDAGNDYMNAIALISGDGLVNWRPKTRWTVYKPGWGAILGFLAELTDNDTGRMQRIITRANALMAPALVLLIMALYRSRVALGVGAVAAMIFAKYPMDNWILMVGMMTEGPTLLASLLFLIVVLFAARRSHWARWEWFLAGFAGSAAILIRAQCKYGVLTVCLLVALTAFLRWKRRWKGLLFFFAGFVIFLAPYLAKTSWNLGTLYTGTSHTSMRALLQYSRMGENVGRAALDEKYMGSELDMMRGYSEKINELVEPRIMEPWKALDEGQKSLETFTLKPLVLLISDDGMKDRKAVQVAYIVVIAGIILATLRFGFIGLIPLGYVTGYLAPNIAFSYYWPRFGIPISWLGVVYACGPLVFVSDPRLLWGWGRAAHLRWRLLRVEFYRALREPQKRKIKSRRMRYALARRRLARRIKSIPRQKGLRYAFKVTLISLLIWFIATALLLYNDHRPFPFYDAEEFLASESAVEAVRAAGLQLDDELTAEITAAVETGKNSERVMWGIAFLPITMKPGDQPLKYAWGQLKASREAYYQIHLIKPWKAGGYSVSKPNIGGEQPDYLEVSDQVLLLKDPKPSDPEAPWRLIPLKWAEEDPEGSTPAARQPPPQTDPTGE